MLVINFNEPFNPNDYKASNPNEEKVLQFIQEWQNDKDTFSASTSGSTGTPKKIALSKARAKISAQNTCQFFNLKAEQSSLLCISPDYIGGKMQIIRAILFRLKLIVVEPSSNPIKELNEKIEFAAMVPLQVETILKENPEKLNLIVNTIIGGAPVSNSLEQKLASLKSNFYSTFGMTETISHIALKKLNSNNYFKCLGDIKVSVNNNNELTILPNSLVHTTIQTNDIIELLNETEFKWLGRGDYIINSGGIKFNPEAIEEKIASYINKRFIISYLEDDILGQKLILIVEGQEENGNINYKYQDVLSKFETPKNIYFLPHFIESGNNKINRIKTRQQLLASIKK